MFTIKQLLKKYIIFLFYFYLNILLQYPFCILIPIFIFHTSMCIHIAQIPTKYTFCAFIPKYPLNNNYPFHYPCRFILNSRVMIHEYEVAVVADGKRSTSPPFHCPPSHSQPNCQKGSKRHHTISKVQNFLITKIN